MTFNWVYDENADELINNLSEDLTKKDIDKVILVSDDGITYNIDKTRLTKTEVISSKVHINKDSSFDLDDFLAKIKKKELSPIKDDTDMALAVEDAVANGCEEIVIFGGLGGARMSHTFANVQLVHRFARKGISIRMYSETNTVQVIVNGSLQLPKKDNGFISIFALTDKAKGVSIKNLFYEYEGDLTNDVALGVSNEFCGKEACVSVSDGALLIIFED